MAMFTKRDKTQKENLSVCQIVIIEQLYVLLFTIKRIALAIIV